MSDQNDPIIDASHLESFAASIAVLVEDVAPQNKSGATISDLVNLMREHESPETFSEQKRSYGSMLCEKELEKQRAEDQSK